MRTRSSAAKRLYASTLDLQYSACVSPYKCLRHIFMLYGYLSLAALVIMLFFLSYLQLKWEQLEPPALAL